MSGTGFSRAIFSIVHTGISLGLLTWGLFLIGYGWPLLHSEGAAERQGGFSFVAGGLLLATAALVGIIFAMMKLRRR